MRAALFQRVKVFALRTSAHLGLTRAIRNSEWRRRRLLILCYHGVSLSDEHGMSGLYVTQQHLRLRCEHIRRNNYRVLRLDEALRMLDAGTLPARSVVITFDDGTYDFIERAYPVLKEFGFPATLYLTTFYCDYQWPVFDTVLAYLLWKGKGQVLSVPRLLTDTVVIPESGPERFALHSSIRAKANELGMSAESKNAVAADVSRQVGQDYDALCRSRMFCQMTPAEVGLLDPALVSVQLHTHRHRTPRDPLLFDRELCDNRSAIERMRSGTDPLNHFCYPSGDVDPRFIPWLLDVGIVSATTCSSGLTTVKTNRLLLPRLLDAMAMPLEVFEGWLSGILAFMPRRG